MATIADAVAIVANLSEPGSAHHSYELGHHRDAMTWRIDYPVDGYDWRDPGCAQYGAKSTTIHVAAHYPNGPHGQTAILISAVDRRVSVPFNDEPRASWLIGDLPLLGSTPIEITDIDRLVVAWLRDHGCPL